MLRIDMGANEAGDTLLCTEPLGLDATLLLPHLEDRSGNWSSETQSLSDLPGIYGFEVQRELHRLRLSFQVSTTDLQSTILQRVLPVFIHTSIVPKHRANLAPPLVEMQHLESIFSSDRIAGLLARSGVTFSFSVCGQHTTPHFRFAIAHSDPQEMATWLWNTLDIFTLHVTTSSSSLVETI